MKLKNGDIIWAKEEIYWTLVEYYSDLLAQCHIDVEKSQSYSKWLDPDKVANNRFEQTTGTTAELFGLEDDIHPGFLVKDIHKLVLWRMST